MDVMNPIDVIERVSEGPLNSNMNVDQSDIKKQLGTDITIYNQSSYREKPVNSYFINKHRQSKK